MRTVRRRNNWPGDLTRVRCAPSEYKYARARVITTIVVVVVVVVVQRRRLVRACGREARPAGRGTRNSGRYNACYLYDRRLVSPTRPNDAKREIRSTVTVFLFVRARRTTAGKLR